MQYSLLLTDRNSNKKKYEIVKKIFSHKMRQKGTLYNTNDWTNVHFYLLKRIQFVLTHLVIPFKMPSSTIFFLPFSRRDAQSH